MTNTQVSSARKFATAAFAGVVALSLMLPAQLAFATYDIGDTTYDGTVDDNGNGSVSGTWDYAAEGQDMTLVDYIGESISATDQDLNVQLVGKNVVEEGIYVSGGDLTINGDSSLYGLDKPSITVNGDTYGFIGASENVAIMDANVTFDTASGGIYGEEVAIEDSGIWRGEENNSLDIYSVNDMEIVGSEVNATNVYAGGELTFDNTNLTVLPSAYVAEAVNSGQDTNWIKSAVAAVKGITLLGEANGEVIANTDELGNLINYYLYTGDDKKVELRASSTPAYWGPAKGMPATGDTTMPLVIGLSITAACAALVTAYAARQRREDF